MPRYFFDVNDGKRSTRDDVGIDLASLDDVEGETRTLLHNLAVPEVMYGRDRAFTAVVRNDQGVTIYRGSVILTIKRESDQP